jgi:hypothetical protein
LSDRRTWLDEWCPYCWSPAGARCRLQRYSSRRRSAGPSAIMHVARGWRGRPCPSCRALAGEPCHTPSGREAARPHEARLRPGRGELVARQAVWEELERRDTTIAVVPFSGRAREGGRTGTITLSVLRGDDLVIEELWSGRELAYALEGPVWDRYAGFAGHPLIRGTVTWTLTDRRIRIAGRRGQTAFEETLA